MLGVCYYPEHWPRELWASDAKRMAGLGLKAVRIGEFAWARMEPKPGQYDWAWLDEAIATLQAEGLGVVLGTPTATPPKWLCDLYPEILPVDIKNGTVRGFGSRRHYDFSSPIYLRESLRIVEQMVDRYGHHPAVIGWQTDNEMTCHDTALSASPAAAEAFRLWCARRYESTEALNQAWGNVFWSMEYASFDEIDLPVMTVCEPNPAHTLAWRRFSSDQVAAYNAAQVSLIRAKVDPRQWVTHNFIPYLDTKVDNFDLCAPLDFASYDSYPLGIADMAMRRAKPEGFAPFMRTGLPDLTGLNLDQTRGLSRMAFWLMEQQPGPVNWAPHNPRPAPGMVRLWSLQAFAHGAACVSYFRWRQAPFAQEQMHAGLLRPDHQPAGAWDEIDQVAGEMAVLGDLTAPREQKPVALIVDALAAYASDIQPQGAGYRYDQVVYDYYSALRGLGLDVDIIRPGASLAGYKLVVAPCLAMPEARDIEALAESQARIVLGPRSGAKTRDFTIPEGLAPGLLQALIPIQVRIVETLRPDCPVSIRMAEKHYQARSWCEALDLRDGASPLATYANGEIAAAQAGRVSYIGTLADQAFLTAFLAEEARTAGLEPQVLPANLRISKRGGLGFGFNYADHPQPSPAPQGARYLIGGPELAAYDVCVWEL